MAAGLNALGKRLLWIPEAAIPGGTPLMKGVGMLVGNFELNPKEDRSGRGPSFFDP